MRTEAERARDRERQRQHRARERRFREDALEVIEWFCHRHPADAARLRDSRLLKEHLPLLHADLRQQKEGTA